MKILVIEDDLKCAKIIRLGLSDAGFDCYVVDTGKKGMNILMHGGCDIVLLDRVLPDMDGKEWLRKVRTSGNKTPVIILSALGTTKERIDGLSSGADDYMVKPFAVDELVARINAVLRRSQHDSDANITFKDLVFNTERGTFSRGGKELALTELESRILELLIRHPGRWMPARFIHSAIWGDEEQNTNVVAAKIYAIRKKINRKGDVPLIECKRGIGYSLK